MFEFCYITILQKNSKKRYFFTSKINNTLVELIILSFKQEYHNQKQTVKKTLLLAISIFLFSCNSEESTIKRVIDNSFHSSFSSKRIKELEIIDQDIYSFSVHSTHLDSNVIPDRSLINKNAEFKVVRHIYKTNSKVFRMFYIIDISNDKLITKSSNYYDFTYPIGVKIFGKDNVKSLDLKGENKLKLMKYK